MNERDAEKYSFFFLCKIFGVCGCVALWLFFKKTCGMNGFGIWDGIHWVWGGWIMGVRFGVYLSSLYYGMKIHEMLFMGLLFLDGEGICVCFFGCGEGVGGRVRG